MATYAIGDVQGCFAKLLELLDHIGYSSADTLWFTGDLVNRGTQSLETLRFIKQLQEQNRIITVLGNHDIAMLAIARGAEPYNPAEHSFEDIIQAEDREELLLWLEKQPLLHYDPVLKYTLVHAGIYPSWTLAQAQSLATEVEQVLRQGVTKQGLYQHIFGNTPVVWDSKLQGYDRLRFIYNAFTRMRFVSADGRLNLTAKESAKEAPGGYLPWYEIPDRKTQHEKILFGHWARLEGKCSAKDTFALDTGCVYGKSLTAFRLEDERRFSVKCN